MLIEEIKRRINIIDLVNDFGLKIYRNNFIKSIYKEEKKPSMKLYPNTNSYCDYSTGTSGDVIKLFMDYERIDFKEAIERLKEKAGIRENKIEVNKYRVPKTNIEKIKVLEIESDYYEERAAIIEYDGEQNKNSAEDDAFQEMMKTREEIQKKVFIEFMQYCNGVSDEAFKYLTGPNRGLTEATLKYFGLFSADKNKKCKEHLINKFCENELIVSGLFNKEGWFVFEHHEIIIPYYDNYELKYLRGRVLPKDIEAAKKNKYISLYNFTTNLGLKRFFNKDQLLKLKNGNEIIICEGEFDTMIAVQNGYDAIGIPGVTNIPRHDLHLINEFEIYVLFDNDEAGKRAINELSKLINKKVNVIQLLNHKDLTELINAGRS